MWNEESLESLLNLQISMVHASTVAVIYSINQLVEVTSSFIFF